MKIEELRSKPEAESEADRLTNFNLPRVQERIKAAKRVNTQCGLSGPAAMTWREIVEPPLAA